MAESTLAELYARNPLDYTTEDLDRVIESQAEARRNYVTNGKKVPTAEPIKSLEDLGL